MNYNGYNSKSEMNNKMQLCTGCRIEHPVDDFRVRDKIKGTLYKQCKLHQKMVADRNRYTYPAMRICPGKCKRNLPIGKFRYRSKRC